MIDYWILLFLPLHTMQITRVYEHVFNNHGAACTHRSHTVERVFVVFPLRWLTTAASYGHKRNNNYRVPPERFGSFLCVYVCAVLISNINQVLIRCTFALNAGKFIYILYLSFTIIASLCLSVAGWLYLRLSFFSCCSLNVSGLFSHSSQWMLPSWLRVIFTPGSLYQL